MVSVDVGQLAFVEVRAPGDRERLDRSGWDAAAFATPLASTVLAGLRSSDARGTAGRRDASAPSETPPLVVATTVGLALACGGP